MTTRGRSGVRADRACSYSKLEASAARVRQHLGVSPDQAIDPLEVFEDLHKISLQRANRQPLPLGYGVVRLEDSEGYARYDRACDVIEILASERTYGWLVQRHPRGAYFVAHELGHCILHTDQLVRLAMMPTNQQAAFHRGRENHEAYYDTEWQANAFASALLMPARGIAAIEHVNRELSVPLIVDRFGVSREAAGYRLELYKRRKTDLLRVWL
jgi:hypothetical protein